MTKYFLFFLLCCLVFGCRRELASTSNQTGTGQLFLWSRTVCCGQTSPIEITVADKKGLLDWTLNSEPPGCDSLDGFIADLLPGDYTWKARCGIDSVTGKVTITENSCIKSEVVMPPTTADGPNNSGTIMIDSGGVNFRNFEYTNLSLGRHRLSAAAAGSKVIFAGGLSSAKCNDHVISAVADIYDVNQKSWIISSLSIARMDMAAAGTNDKILFAGGNAEGFGTVTRVDIYNTTTNTWSTAEMSEPRSNMATAVAGDKIYIAGGNQDYYSPGDKMDVYDAKNNTWSVITMPRYRIYIMYI